MSFDLIDRKFGQPRPSVGHDFHCHVCGVETDFATDPPGKTTCPTHCPDHDFRFDDTVGFVCCIHCLGQAPFDWEGP